jgi:hypothetical protein
MRSRKAQMAVIIDATGEEVKVLSYNDLDRRATVLHKDGSVDQVSTYFLVSDGGVPELKEQVKLNKGLLNEYLTTGRLE